MNVKVSDTEEQDERQSPPVALCGISAIRILIGSRAVEMQPSSGFQQHGKRYAVLIHDGETLEWPTNGGFRVRVSVVSDEMSESDAADAAESE